MKWFYMQAGAMPLLIAALAALYLPPEADDGRQYYDGNGNHVYYDRRLIARPEKEKEEELQENNH